MADDLRDIAVASRDTARLMGQIAARMDALESGAEARSAAMAELKAQLVPVALYFDTLNKANAETLAGKLTADQRAETARVAWFASFIERFTISRMVTVAAILIPLCSGGGFAAGNSDVLARIASALDALFTTAPTVGAVETIP